MTKRVLVSAIAVLLLAGVSFAAGTKTQTTAKARTFIGVITDSHCGAKGHMGSAADCVKKCISMGAKYALVYRGKAYVLDPQDMAADHPGGSRVRVRGTLSGDTITATSITAVKSSKSM